MRPRFIVTWAMRTETADLLVRVGDPSNQLLDPLYSAVRALAQAAYGQGIYADDALEGLAEIRGKLRALR